MEPQFIHMDDIHPFELGEGIGCRPLFGESVMMNLVELEPGAVVPAHRHPHEQLGITLRGLLVLIVDGVEHPLGPMDACVLPGGVEHGARAGPEGATVLDVFRPIREDYRERWQEANPTQKET